EIGDAPVDLLTLHRQPLEQGGGGTAVDDAGHEIDDRLAGQPSRVELLDQVDLADRTLGVVALATGAALGAEQALLLVVAEGPDTDPTPGREFSNTHLFSQMTLTTLLASNVNVRS